MEEIPYSPVTMVKEALFLCVQDFSPVCPFKEQDSDTQEEGGQQVRMTSLPPDQWGERAPLMKAEMDVGTDAEEEVRPKERGESQVNQSA